MRKRSKVCFKCNEPKEVLYRCQYVDLKDWVFSAIRVSSKSRKHIQTRIDTVERGRVKKVGFNPERYIEVPYPIKL